MDEKNKDSQNLLMAQKGDKKAVAALYDMHHQAVYRYIYYRVSNPADAEDLAAEVFIRMIRKLPGYRDRGKPLLAWLYTIARNLVVDHYRSLDRVEFLPIKDQILEEESPGPSQQLEREQIEGCFKRALERLSESQRSILLFRFVENYSTEKILRLLDRSDRAMRSLQHRALRSLENALREENCL